MNSRQDEYTRILIRAANWVGDAVMSLPALREVRHRFPRAHIAVLARPWVADLYRRESFADEVVPYRPAPGARDWAAKWRVARELRSMKFDAALLIPNSFESAAVATLARIPHRAGYARDGRGPLLTQAVAPPRRGETPRHESYYYLELLRRLGWIARLPAPAAIRLEGLEAARREGSGRLAAAGLVGPVTGASPGAAYGGAKRWLPERFVEAAAQVARSLGGPVGVFGTAAEVEVCSTVAAGLESQGVRAKTFAGATSLADFIDMASACRVFLTNDSGAMHIASAAGVPTVAVFGATDHEATGPTGELARVIRQPVECSPCLKRECPIDHRCMTRVTAEMVSVAALELVGSKLPK